MVRRKYQDGDKIVWTDPMPAFYFKKLHISFLLQTPVKSQKVINETFDLKSATEEFTHGAKVQRTVIINWAHIQQRSVRTMSYTLEGSVENVGGTAWEIGLSGGAEGKLGGDKGAEASASGEGTFARSLEDGKAVDTSETDSMEVEIEVPAHSKVAVSIKASRKKVKIKYTGILHTRFIDGTEKKEPTEGYKHEISTESAVVEYGRFQPLLTEGNMNVEPKPVSKADPLSAAMADTEGADILYRKKFEDSNAETWKSADYFKRAAYDIAFFRPIVNVLAKECALGDVAVRGREFPNLGHLLVKATKEGAIAHPREFRKIYSTKGASTNVDIYEMIPDSADYKCIGHVARAKGEAPVLEEYCCVKTKYLVKAKPEWIWNTKGGDRNKATVWSVVRDDFGEEALSGETHGVFSASFMLQPNNEDFNTQPYSEFWQLNGDEHNVISSVLVGRVESKPLELVEKDTTEVWKGNFLGSACKTDQEKYYKYRYGVFTSCENQPGANIWVYRTPRIKGYYNLGDTALTYEPSLPPKGYLIKAKREKETNDHIRLPDSFRLVWREPYRRLEAGVAFWMPNCPPGFAALGGVMTDMISKGSKNIK